MTFKIEWSRPQKFEEGNFSVDLEGVYVIGYRDTADDKLYVEYVGQGIIGERLKEHFEENDRVLEQISVAGRVGYYRYVEVKNENDRLDIELWLYRKYGGDELCNEIEPPGSGRDSAIEVEELRPND